MVDEDQVSPEIMESLNKYFGFEHVIINNIGELDINKMAAQNERAWNVKIQNIEETIEDFVNIYGFIYEHGSRSVDTISRGTTVREVSALRPGKEIGSFISTSRDEQIVKRFATDGSAVVRIMLGENVPHVYVEDLKGRGSDTEEEIMIIPFTKCESVTFRSDWNGIKYYSVRISRDELPEIENEELEALRLECIQGFPEFIALSEKYQELMDDHESKRRIQKKMHEDMLRKLKSKDGLTKADRDERSSISQNIENLENEIFEIRNKIDAFREKFIRMLKGLCRQREKEIDIRVKDLEAEQRKKEALESEKRLRESVNEKEKSIKTTVNIFNRDVIDQIKENDAASKILGINISGINISDKNNINKYVKEIISSIDNPENSFDETLEQKNERYSMASQYTDKNLSSLVREIMHYSDTEIHENLHSKVKAIILSSVRKKLEEERASISNKKLSIIQRAFGGKRLKEAKLKNIDAKLRLEDITIETNNPENSIIGMLQEMYEYAFKYNNGVLTEEMQGMESAIRHYLEYEKKKIPTQEEIRNAVLKKQVTLLPAVVKNKAPLFSLTSIRRNTRMLEEDTQNTYLEEARKREYNGIRITPRQVLSKEKIFNTLDNINKMVSAPAPSTRSVPSNEQDLDDKTW